jgi:hypothetical protein
MMECPHCKTANRLGAIFCRSCGAKLELDSITAETFEQVTGVVPKDKADKKRRIKSTIINVIRLAFLAAIVIGFYLALQRPKVEQPETDSRLGSQFKESMRKLLQDIEQKKTPPQWVTSEQAVNSYIAGMLAETKEKGKTFKLVDMWLVIEDSGDLDWVIDVKLFGRLMRIQYLGTIEKVDGKYTLTPKGFFAVHMGKLPLPTPLMNLWARRLWRSLIEGDKERLIEKLLDAVTELKFQGDTITVTVSP